MKMNYFGTKRNKLSNLANNTFIKNNTSFILIFFNILYITILGSLLYLDHSLFSTFFGFEKGLFSSVFKIDLITTSSTLFLIFFPFIFIILYISISILVHHRFTLKFKEKLSIEIIQKKYTDVNLIKQAKNILKNNESKKEIIYIISVMLIHPLLLIIVFLFLKSIFIYFIFLIILNIFSIYYIKIWLQRLHILIVSSIIIITLLLLFLYVMFLQKTILSNENIQFIHTFIQFFIISNLSLIINYILMVIYADILTNLSKQKEVKNNLIILPFIAICVITVYNFFLSNSNEDYWSQELKPNNDFTMNILLNKANLQTNYLDILIKIKNKYFENLINQITYDDSISVIACEKINNLNCEYTYTLDDNYLFINISSNIKIYFKNLFINDKFIGYRMFIIEEKKYTNKEGSEYILLVAKNKFVKDFEKFEKRKELLAKLLPENAIEKIKENTNVFKINKDLANQQLINQYYISYFEKEDNIFIYNDSISKDTLKSIKEKDLKN